MGHIQHGPPVALGETFPVVWAARSSAMDDLRRTLFLTSHIEAPVESIGRGFFIVRPAGSSWLSTVWNPRPFAPRSPHRISKLRAFPSTALDHLIEGFILLS